MTNEQENNSITGKVLIGVGVGAAIAVAVAMSRRRNSRWYDAKRVTLRMADKTGDLAAVSKDIVEHLKVIYSESCKLVDQASDLWSQGRKIVRT
jgi:hypothetical protein